MIHLHISGRIVRDPENRTSASGKAYTQALIVSSSKEAEQLVTVMAFDSDGQVLLSSLRKGDSLSALGSGSFRAYTDKEGLPATGITCMANRLMALADSGTKAARKQEETTVRKPTAPPRREPEPELEPVFDDAIPF